MINELIEQIGGRERLEDIKSRIEMYGHGAGYTADEVELMARALLAVLGAQEKPAAYIVSDKYDREAGRAGLLSFRGVISYSDDDINEHELLEKPLYTTPQAASAPEGWKLVLLKAFPSQWAAGQRAFDAAGINKIYPVYRDMLAAAPTPGGKK